MSAVLTRIYDGAAARIRAVTDTQVVLGPSINPGDRIIIVHPYVLSDDLAEGPDTLLGLQIRMRRGSNDGYTGLLDEQQAIFDSLHLLSHADYSGVEVALTWRQASVQVSLDGSGRPEVVDTYHLRGLSLSA